MRWMHKYIRLSKEGKKIFFETLFFFFFSKLILFFILFKRCLKLLNSAEKMTVRSNPEFLRKIRDAVSRANRLAFWNNVCLVKSFAARLMLQRREIGSVMYLGLQMGTEKKLIAHAWLIAKDIYITSKGSKRYKKIFSI